MVANNLTEEEIVKRISAYQAFSNRTSKDTYDKVLNRDPSEIYKQPTNLYLFKTKYEGINKFGITQFHPNKRAQSQKGKEFYEELIFHIELEDRYQAIAVEQAFKFLFENSFIINNLGTDWKQKTWICPDDHESWERPEDFCKEATRKQALMHHYSLSKKEMDKLIRELNKVKDLLGLEKGMTRYVTRERQGITELTRMNVSEFESKVNEILSSYKKLNSWDFGKKYLGSRMVWCQKMVDDVLVKKEEIFIVEFGRISHYYEYDYKNKNYDPLDPKSRLKRKKLKPPYRLKQKKDDKAFHVPIKDLPKLYEQYNKVKLF